MASKSFGAASLLAGGCWCRRSSGRPGTGLAGTHRENWQNWQGVVFPTFTLGPPTMLQPSACVGALIGGWWTIYGSDHGRCGPMGMARTAALASTRASAEAPRASISHSTCFTVQLPYHYYRSGLETVESPSSAGLFPESCIVCMTRND